jgi:hypothetical protein
MAWYLIKHRNNFTIMMKQKAPFCKGRELSPVSSR